MPISITFEYDVFISYNQNDEAWARQLATRLEQEDLHGRKLRVFFAPWDIKPGESIPERLEHALPRSRKVCLLMSPESAASEWVKVERYVTQHIDIHERRSRLIPLYLRPSEIPPFLQHINRVDFQDDAKFEDGYRILLATIKDEPLPRGEAKSSKGATTPAPIPRPPVVGFVARRDTEGRDIVERLREELAPQKNQLVALSGPGGVGKTTLAAEVARTHRQVLEHRVIWISALGRDDFSLATLLDEIAAQLGEPDLRTLAPEPKAEQVQVLLATTPTLIILDNFETISEAEQFRCIEYLLNRAPCPVLITTRQRIDTARNIVIPVMSPEEANDFLQRLTEQTGDPSTFAQPQRERIIEASERNPLVMQWIVGQISLAQDAETVLDELTHGAGDAARRVFDRSFRLEQLGDDGRATLLALSLFTPDASRAALAEVAGFAGDVKRLNEAVKRLASLWMVKTTAAGSRLTVEGLTRELAKACLENHEDARNIRQRFVSYFLRYASSYQQPTAEAYDALEAEKDNVTKAMDVAFQMREWNSVRQILSMIYHEPHGFLLLRGYWDEAIALNDLASIAARELGDEGSEVVFATNAATVRMKRGEYGLAKQVYERSYEFAKAKGNKSNIAVCLHRLGMIARFEGDGPAGHRLFKECLEVRKEIEDHYGVACTLANLGQSEYDQGNLDEAKRLYEESLNIFLTLDQQIDAAISIWELGRIAENQGDLMEANKRFEESLAVFRKFGDQENIAGVLGELGRVALRQKDFDEARRCFEECLRIRKKPNNEPGIASALVALGLLSQEENNQEEAERSMLAALRIFEKLNSPHADPVRRWLQSFGSESS